MKKTIISFVFFWIGVFSYAQVTQHRILGDFTNGISQYTFNTLGVQDVVYRDAIGTNFANRNTGAICAGAVYRTELSSVILHLQSSATSSLSIHGASSGSTTRTLTSIQTSSTLNGTYTSLTGYTTASDVDGTCGTIDVNGILIPANTYIRFNFSGNVRFSGVDITQANIISEPDVQASSISFNNISTDSFLVNWTSGNGANRVVFVKEGSQGSIVDPSDNDVFTASNNWNSGAPSGSELGASGYFCVYNGSGSSVNLLNLNPFSTYWIRIYEYNGTGTDSDYLLSTASNNPNSQSTLALPITANFTGIMNIGETVEGNYNYNEFPGDEEGVSQYQWYRAEDSFGLNQAAIFGATSLTYILQLTDEGKYIRFGVVPTDINNMSGSESFSDWQLVNSRPVASSVNVTGILNVTEQVSASYSYADVDNDLEGSSTYQWYRADDEFGTNSEAISGANSIDYTLTGTDLAKYIQFSITPVALSGSTPGNQVDGNWVGPVLSQNASSVIASGTLTENSLNLDVVTLQLVNDTFTTNTLDANDFTLNNAPSGLTVDQVAWVSSTEAQVTFSYNEEDFDVDVTNFSISVDASILDSNTTLTTLEFTISAVIETLEVSGDLIFEDICVNQQSEIGSFEITGTNLKPGNINVSALDGFEYAETIGGVYSSEINFMHSGGNLISKTIFVRFMPSAVADYSDSIEVVSIGAPSVYQAVTASGILLPSLISSPSSAMIGSTQATLGGDITEIGCSEIIERGIFYSTTNGFVDGDGIKVSETSTAFESGAFSTLVSGLLTGTTYYFKAFARGADDVTIYTSQATFSTLSISSPTALEATNLTCNSFVANWEAVAGATSYRLDVSTYPDFGYITLNPGQVLLSNTAVLGLPGWSETNVSVSSGALQMVSPTSQIVTAPFDISSFTGVELNFLIRTFGGVTGNSNQVVVSISTDNGMNWSNLGTTTAGGSSLNPADAYSLDGYLGTQVRLRFETPNATGSRGIGLDNITVTGDENIFIPSFVEDYQDVTVGGLSLEVIGVNPGTNYYYRVRSTDISSVSENSNTANTLTLPPTLWYADSDGDGFGDDNDTLLACESPVSYVSVGGDCDDTNNTVYPGAAEICYDGLDNDCDGIIDNGCTPIVSVVQPAQCGITLPTIDSYVYANLVAGAQGYRFRVTNLSTNEVQTIDRALRVFRFTQLTSYAFATEYSVEVSVRINNVWQPFYGTPCNVSTPDTTTQVQASQCNTAISNVNNAIFADIVPFATGYRFRVTNTLNPIDVQTIDRPIRDFRMTNLTNVQYNTTYNVEVAVRNTDGTYLSYGPVCNITTPLFPTVGLEDAQCDEYLVSSNTEILYAESYPGVEQYRFLLENVSLAYSQTVDRATRTVTLNNFTGLVPGEMYTVRVAIRLNGVWGPYGKSCSVITPGGEIIVIRPGDSMGETEFKAIAYPNPFATSFTIDVKTSNTEAVSLTVYDMTGRLLEVKEVKAQDVTNYQFGDRYPSGVYNIIVTQGEETRTVRVVKQ